MSKEIKDVTIQIEHFDFKNKEVWVDVQEIMLSYHISRSKLFRYLKEIDYVKKYNRFFYKEKDVLLVLVKKQLLLVTN